MLADFCQNIIWIPMCRWKDIKIDVKRNRNDSVQTIHLFQNSDQ
jgi:hypothetical protein